jgi:hypothetical protein
MIVGLGRLGGGTCRGRQERAAGDVVRDCRVGDSGCPVLCDQRSWMSLAVRRLESRIGTGGIGCPAVNGMSAISRMASLWSFCAPQSGPGPVSADESPVGGPEQEHVHRITMGLGPAITPDLAVSHVPRRVARSHARVCRTRERRPPRRQCRRSPGRAGRPKRRTVRRPHRSWSCWLPYGPWTLTR